MNKIIIIGCVFIGLFFLVVVMLEQRSSKNMKDKRYTIAHIIKKENKKNEAVYHYQYVVKNTTYKGTFRRHKTHPNMGARVFVSFDPSNPHQSFTELQFPAPGPNWVAPELGWEKIPEQP